MFLKIIKEPLILGIPNLDNNYRHIKNDVPNNISSVDSKYFFNKVKLSVLF
jgi:hypothetical protein